MRCSWNSRSVAATTARSRSPSTPSESAGPTTEVLVDVVGYTTDARLKAIETSLATKANSADVYTKAEIDAKLAGKLDNAKVLWAIVNSDGTLDQGKGALVAGTAKLAGLGTYEVAFERDITACAAIANAGR